MCFSKSYNFCLKHFFISFIFFKIFVRIIKIAHPVCGGWVGGYGARARACVYFVYNIYMYVNIGRFYDKRDAEDALDAMDGRLLDGRELRVQMARYGRPTSPHRSRGSRRRGR